MSHEHGFSSPVASTKVCRIHRVIGRYQGVLPQEARKDCACLLYSTDCECLEIGQDHEDIVFWSNAAGPHWASHYENYFSSKMTATLPFSLGRHSLPFL